MNIDVNIIVGAFLTAIPPTILAYATLKQSQKNAEKAVESDKKVSEATEKIVEIHTATNGNLSIMTTELEVAREEIKGLKTLVATIAPVTLAVKETKI